MSGFSSAGFRERISEQLRHAYELVFYSGQRWHHFFLFVCTRVLRVYRVSDNFRHEIHGVMPCFFFAHVAPPYFPFNSMLTLFLSLSLNAHSFVKITVEISQFCRGHYFLIWAYYNGFDNIVTINPIKREKRELSMSKFIMETIIFTLSDPRDGNLRAKVHTM